MNWFKKWWHKSTYTEKIMYALVLVMVIGILTRWNYVWGEIGGAFSALIPSKDSTEQVANGSKMPTLELPTPPSMLNEAERASWMATHYWDKADLRDTVWVGFPDTFAGYVAEWGAILQQTDDATTAEAVRTFMTKSHQDPKVGKLAREKVEWAFYDPNSPIRNFEAYIAALQWIVASPDISETDKIRPAAQLEMALKNRKGTLANDFTYATPEGTKSTLYKIRTPYTLVYINNPGCPACREYMQTISASPIINNVLSNRQLTILGIYPDDDMQTWEEYASEFPVGWINGIDLGQKIKAAGSYELNVIPTLLLLDKDKRVLIKDGKPEQIDTFFANFN